MYLLPQALSLIYMLMTPVVFPIIGSSARKYPSGGQLGRPLSRPTGTWGPTCSRILVVGHRFLHRLPLQPTHSQTRLRMWFWMNWTRLHQSRNAFGVNLSQSPSGCHPKRLMLEENVADRRSCGRPAVTRTTTSPYHRCCLSANKRLITHTATSSADRSLVVKTSVNNGRLQRSYYVPQIQTRKEPTLRINHFVTYFPLFFHSNINTYTQTSLSQ